LIIDTLDPSAGFKNIEVGTSVTDDEVLTIIRPYSFETGIGLSA
jgi:hypothetical protein